VKTEQGETYDRRRDSGVPGHKFCTIGLKSASLCGVKASALPPGFCPAFGMVQDF